MTDSAGVRPDLDAAARAASRRPIPLRMDLAERQRLMDVLLRISDIALAAFDALDKDAVSEHDTFVMLQLPDYCNAFTQGITRHAKARIEMQEKVRRIGEVHVSEEGHLPRIGGSNGTS